jgi:hypothetical protein
LMEVTLAVCQSLWDLKLLKNNIAFCMLKWDNLRGAN